MWRRKRSNNNDYPRYNPTKQQASKPRKGSVARSSSGGASLNSVADEVMGYGEPDDAMGYGPPPGHFGKAVLTPRKRTPKAAHHTNRQGH